MGDGGAGTDEPVDGRSGTHAGAADPRGVLRDWIDIWHSEASAAAVDPQAQEAAQRAASLWAQAAHAWADLLPAGTQAQRDPAAGRAGAVAAPRPTTAPPAPDPRDLAIEGLGRRLAELERRLAELEAGRH